MRRTVTAASVVASVVAGGVLGVGLHAVWDPFDRAAGTPPGAPPPSSSATPIPSPRRTPVSPSPTPTPTQVPTPTATGSAPAFTERALLQPEEFVARGWEVAHRIDTFDELPTPAITPCATVDAGRHGVVAGFAATSASDRTTAAEVVARFDDADQAGTAYRELRAEIAVCADASASPKRLRISGSYHPDVADVDDLRWWTTRPLDDGPARGVIGIVRVDDRIAVVSLSSDLSDPAETTKIESLLTQAGLRLV